MISNIGEPIIVMIVASKMLGAKNGKMTCRMVCQRLAPSTLALQHELAPRVWRRHEMTMLNQHSLRPMLNLRTWLVSPTFDFRSWILNKAKLLIGPLFPQHEGPDVEATW
jgi:hypothetical protein